MKTRENVVVLDLLAVDNFDFTRNIVKKILGEKLMKMLGFCQNWIFGQKFDFSNSVLNWRRGKINIDFLKESSVSQGGPFFFLVANEGT